MIAWNRSHKTASRALCRTIALVQLLVLLLLAVPAHAYELVLDQGTSDVCLSVGHSDAGHDECPCCPGENKSDEGTSDRDGCSTCSYCSFFTPLTTVLTVVYTPSVAELVSNEPFTKLLEVHIPIFHPPQNRA
jgi:hypothetical protein